MTEWLSPLNILWAGALVVVAIASWWVRGELAPEPEPPPPKTDTVIVERQITRRDTVTEAVPRKVIQYDTVSVTERDTIKIEVPTVDTVAGDTVRQVPWRPFGLISNRPVRVNGTTFILSYYQLAAQRWEQREYEADVSRPEWKLTANGGLTSGRQYAHTSSTLGLSKRTSVGWLGIHAGYGLAVTDQVRRGFVGRVTLRSTLYSW